MLQPKKPSNGLSEKDNQLLISELTKYAEEGASDDDLREFKNTFISLKKKEVSTSTPTSTNQKLDSVQKVGSSDIQKSQNKTLPVDEFGVTNFNQPRTQPKVETAPIAEKQPLVQTDSLGTTDFGKTPFTPETDLNISISDNERMDNEKKKALNYINQVDKAKSFERLKSEINDKEVGDYLREGGKQVLGAIINPFADIARDVYGLVTGDKTVGDATRKQKDFISTKPKVPLVSQMEQAKKEFRDKGIEPSPLYNFKLQKRAEEIFLEEDEYNQRESNANDYFTSGSPTAEEVKKQLGIDQIIKTRVLEDKARQKAIYSKVIEAEAPVVKQDYEKAVNEYLEKVDSKKVFTTQQEVDEANAVINNLKIAEENLTKFNKKVDYHLKSDLQLDINNSADDIFLFTNNYRLLDKTIDQIVGITKTLAGGAVKVGLEVLIPEAEEGDESLSGKVASSEIGKKVRSVLSDVSTDVIKEGEEQIRPYRRIDIESINSFTDYGRYALGLVAEQAPILGAMFSAGPAGLGVVSAGSGGQAIYQMEEESKKPFGRIYTNSEKLTAGIGYSLAEYFPERYVTLPLIDRLKKSYNSPFTSKIDRELFTKGIFEESKLFFDKVIPTALMPVKEGLSEVVTGVLQEDLVDVNLLGKEKKAGAEKRRLNEFIAGAFISGGIQSLQALPSIYGAVVRKVSDNSSLLKAKELMSDVEKIKVELNRTDLTIEDRQILKKELDTRLDQTATVIQESSKKAQKLAKPLILEILDINSKTDAILDEAKIIRESNISKDLKQQKLNELNVVFNELQNKKEGIVNGKIIEFDLLPIKEIDSFKKKALKELTAELNPDGTKNIKIEDIEITKKAVELYEESKPKAVVEQEPETQPQAEKQAVEPKVEIPDWHRQEYDSRLEEYNNEISNTKKSLEKEKAKGFFIRSKSWIKFYEDNIKFYEDKAKLLQENPIEFYKSELKGVKEQHEERLLDKTTYKQSLIDSFGTTDFEVTHSNFIEDTNRKISDYEKIQKTSEKQAEVVEVETPQAGSVGVVGDAEYNDFIDKGKVSNERLNDIANKVKNREPLSDREKAIFSDKTGEINKIIATKAGSVGVGGDVDLGNNTIIVNMSLPLDSGVNTGLVKNSKGAVYHDKNTSKLEKLGYSKEQIDKLSQAELDEILAKNIENPNVETSAKMPLAEKQTTTQEFLNEANKEGGRFAELAKALKQFFGIDGVETEIVKGLKDFFGKNNDGDYANNKIRIDEKAKNKLQTFLHEAIHKVTVDKLLQFERGDYSKLSKQDIEAIQNLTRIFNESKAKIHEFLGGGKGDRTKGHYGFTNVHEFISEAFTNPEFQSLLKNLPTEGNNPTIFKQFLDAVAKFLGVKDASILNDIFYYTENLNNKAVEQSLKETPQAETNEATPTNNNQINEVNENAVVEENIEVIPVDEEIIMPFNFENSDAIETGITNKYKGQKNIVFHGSPNISYLNSIDDINTIENTKNSKSKYLNVSAKPSTAVAYAKSYNGYGQNSGIAAFELKGKKYVLKKEDIVNLKNEKDYENFYDQKKSEGYDYIEVPQDANNIVVLNNNALKYKEKHLNKEFIKSNKVSNEATPNQNKTKSLFTGRKKEIKDFKETKGEFIFFSQNEGVAEKYGEVTRADVDTENFLDLSSQEKKSELIESMTDDEIIKVFKIKESDRSRFPKPISEEVTIFKESVKDGSQRFSAQGELQTSLLRYIKSKGYDGVVLQDAQYGKLDNSYVVFNKNVINKNEATPTNITPTDGNIQPRVGNMAEMGVEEQPTAEVIAEENIQPSNEAGAVEVKNKVEDIDINDIENFLNEMYSKNNQNENNKPTADKGNERAESNSAEQNIGEPKSEEKAKKISLKGRTPIAKRKFKGDRAKANAVEPSDVYSLVLNYFVSGGKIGSASVKELLKSDSEVKARNNGFNGISKKSAKETDALAHDLWQLALSLGIQTDTQLVKEAIEDIVGSHNTNQDITNTILKRNNLELSEEDKIKKLEDFYIAQAVFDQVQEQNDASDEEMQEAQGALDMLSDAEIIELANNQSKSYDDYLKDLEERRVTFNFGPFEEVGTVQSDGSIINDEGEIFSKESVSNVKQVNPKSQKEKVTKVPTGVTGKGTKNVSASAKSLLKEIDKKIEDARQKVRTAKEALDRKAKSLDKEIAKDQENLFGERKSSAEAKLFDERVNAQARNKATESERNAIKTAQDELRKLIQTKKDVESGKITSNQVDLEDAVNQENKKLSDQVRKLKINLGKLSGGGLQSNPLGLPVAIWNASMDIIATSIDAGMGLAEAIKRGLNYIQKNHRGAWNKKQFNDEVLKELGVRGITINGEDLIVKDTNKEFAETINGFYSDIEQSLIDTKKDSLTAEEWETVVGKTDEAKFTGLNDWLNSQQGNISKSDIRKFLKENRIEIVEVVKGGHKYDDKLASLYKKYDVDSMSRLMNVATKEDIADLDRLYEGENNQTKFSQYQLEGEKENYKEVLVTMPNKEAIREAEIEAKRRKAGIMDNFNFETMGYNDTRNVPKFISSHFDEPNILVHLRMNTRTDADGNKVLFLEEVQSDWGQIGKKEGFGSNEKNDYNKLASELQGEYEVDGQDIFSDVINVKQGTAIQKLNAMDRLTKYFGKERALKIVENQGQSKIPSAPFVTNTNSWAKLGVKVALKEAINQNVDKIAWTTGEQQNERYDLSKSVEKVSVGKNKDGTYEIDIVKKGDSGNAWSKVASDVKEQNIQDYVGKEIADKVITTGQVKYEGLDLKVGGKGMKGFYGSPKEGKLGIIGEVVKALTKQDVKTTTFDNITTKWFDSQEEADNYYKDRKNAQITQNSINITPELKSEVKKGMPMFGNLKDQQKAMVNAEVDKIAQKVKDFLPGIKDGDNLNAQGFTQDQLIDLIANAVKNLVAAGIDINEAIKQVVESIKGKFGVDVNPDDVKAKLKSDRNKNFKKKSGKKSVLGRAVSGGEPLNITEEIEKYGLDYEVESQAKAQENAKEFVKAVGRENALIAVRSGQIKGAEKAFVYAEIIDGIVKEMDSVTIETPDRIALNAQHSIIMGEIMNEFDIQSREAARFISALNRVYFSTYFKYNLSRQINLYKARNGEEISPEKLQEYKETDAKLKELERKIEEAEKRAEEAEAKLAMENIVEEVNNPPKTKPKKKFAVSKEKREERQALKKEILRDYFGTLNDVTRFMGMLADPKVIKYLKLTLEENGGDFIDFSRTLIDDLGGGVRKYVKELYLKAGGKEESITKFNDSAIFIDEDGKITVPKSVLIDLIKDGVTEIDELSQRVLDIINEDYPDTNYTLRQVRDAITKYGKTINPDPDTISTEIRKLKRLGKLISGLEDAKSGKRPLKSGLQRDEITQLERKLKRELKDLLRDLPLDDDSVKKTWKTALDAIKSRLRNQIEDLEKQIANKEKSKPEKTPVEYDEEAKALKQKRDELKDTLESIVGKPELSEEKKIIKAIAMLEKSIQNLNEQIADNNIAYKIKPTPVTSARIEELKKQKAELVEQIKQMRIDSGIAEARRLQSAKSRIKNRIAELEKRIKEKNYTTKKPTPLKADQELLDLQAEKIRTQEVYDKDKYIDELKNRTDRQKAIDAALGLWGIPRVVMATGEASWIFIQGGIQTVNRTLKNPVQMFKIFKKMFKAMASDSKAKEYESLTKARKDYPIMKRAKLALTEVDHKLEAKEEQFLGDYANTVWDFIGVGLRKLSKNKEYRSPFSYFRQMLGKELNSADKATIEQYWKNINPLRILERGNTVYMNELRMARFEEGIEMLQSELKDPIEDIEDYKMLASAINTMTGRANIGSLQANSKILAAIFFSFRNAVSVFNQLNPIFYLYQLHNPKDPITKVSVAQKIAVADMMRFVAFTTGMMLLLQAAMGDDEEGNPKMTIETDPRSSDFGKMKMGDLRIDPWHGMMPMVVLISRMFTDESKNVNTGEVTAGGTKFGTRTRNELAVDFITNKFNPSMGILWGYGSSHKVTENGVEIRKDMFGNEINVLDEVANLQPMYWDAVSEIKKEQPGLWGDFFVAAGALGINSQVYDKPKSKVSSGFNRPRRPSFERPKRP